MIARGNQSIAPCELNIPEPRRRARVDSFLIDFAEEEVTIGGDMTGEIWVIGGGGGIRGIARS